MGGEERKTGTAAGMGEWGGGDGGA